MENVLGIVMARAGSAGLKDKHLLPLMGRPVISYTLDHAMAARSLERTVLSSDSPDIRRLAERAFFQTILRPAELATAEASVQDVLLHALRTVEKTGTFHADAVVVLYGNVPVRPADVIDRAVAKLHETKCDSVRSFCPVGKWHPAWMARIESDRVVAVQAGSIHRRQDLEPLYLHDGAVIAVTRATLEKAESMRGDPHAFFGADRRAIFTGAGETVEIDELRDLFWAEAVLRVGSGDKPGNARAA